MGLSRRTRTTLDIWPGFVDVLASLLMVIIFLLMIFVISQIFLNDALSGRDKQLENLNLQISELADSLNLERQTSESLEANITNLKADLVASLAEKTSLEDALANLGDENSSLKQLNTDLNEQISALGNQLSDESLSNKELAALNQALEETRQKAESQIQADKETISAKLQEVAALTQKINALQILKENIEQDLLERDAEIIASDQLNEQQRLELLRSQAQIADLQNSSKILNQELAALNQILGKYEEDNEAQKAQIISLGQKLNSALATKVQELARYRSEFFGRLREVLGERQDIQIKGDRFIFQSELLFNQGQDSLGEEGQAEVASIAKVLLKIIPEIPKDIDWIIRIDGHTDKIPINTFKFPSNWELSSARAIAVARQLIKSGIAENRVAPTGFGSYHPIDDREDEIAFRRNRRIELKITQR